MKRAHYTVGQAKVGEVTEMGHQTRAQKPSAIVQPWAVLPTTELGTHINLVTWFLPNR